MAIDEVAGRWVIINDIRIYSIFKIGMEVLSQKFGRTYVVCILIVCFDWSFIDFFPNCPTASKVALVQVMVWCFIDGLHCKQWDIDLHK